MTYQAAVVGGSGYTGAELMRLASSHPDIDIVHVTAATNAGARVGDLFPSLEPEYGAMTFAPYSPDDLAGLDVVFLALPHGESQRIAGALVDRVDHVVDLGADFRLPGDQYARWYGEEHTAPDLIERFAFGMPEIFRDTLGSARHVANPGCYPTAVALALAPLVAASMVECEGIVADCISGVSGAGRAAKVHTLFSEAGEQVSAYGLLDHRHTAEMELALSHVAGAPVQVLFTPHLAPITRGILATCYARPKVSGLSTEGLLDLYRAHYSDEPFVTVVAEPSGTRATYGSNSVHVTVRYDARTETIVAVAAEDNLVKGASGQAIQNANRLLGLAETTGLPRLGIAP